MTYTNKQWISLHGLSIIVSNAVMEKKVFITQKGYSTMEKRKASKLIKIKGKLKIKTALNTYTRTYIYTSTLRIKFKIVAE